MELPELYSNLDSLLMKSQDDLEQAVESYTVFCGDYAEKTMIYRRKRSKVIRKLKEAGTPVTLIPDIARGKCAVSKRDMIIAESNKKYIEKLITAIESRINAYKFIGRKTDNLVR